MSADDIRDLLSEGARAPRRPVDITQIRRRSARRRRTVMGAAVLLLIAVSSITVVTETVPRPRFFTEAAHEVVIPDAGEDGALDHGAALWGRRFRAVAVSENDQPRALAPDSSTWVEFEYRTAEPLVGVARWNGGCNTTGSPVEITAERLIVVEKSSRGSTAMGCPVESHAQDNWFERFFDTDPYWRLDGGRLWLWSADVLIEWEEEQAAR